MCRYYAGQFGNFNANSIAWKRGSLRYGPNLGKHGLGLGVSTELVVNHCQAPRSVDFARSCARGPKRR